MGGACSIGLIFAGCLPQLGENCYNRLVLSDKLSPLLQKNDDLFDLAGCFRLKLKKHCWFVLWLS